MDKRKSGKTKKRIGVFVCHCGINIAGTVKIDEVLKKLKTDPDVAGGQRPPGPLL